MKLVFKLIKDENKIEPLFLSDDSSANQISLSHNLQIIRSFIPKEEKDNISFVTLYTQCSKWYDDDCQKIHFLVKIKNNTPEKVIKYSDNNYDLFDIRDILNEEIQDKNIEYKIFDFNGKLELF